jgi:hypothetical protein
VKSRILGTSLAAVLLACFCLLSPRESSAQQGANNWIGARLSIALSPVGFEDPFSGPLGLGLYYERHRIVGGLFLGGQATLYGFYPLRSEFGRSLMLVGALKAGYDFVIPVERRFAFGVSPYLGGGFYRRRFDHLDKSYSSSRPVLSAGVELNLMVRRHGLLGVNLETTLILDEQLRVTVGQGQRIGVRF